MKITEEQEKIINSFLCERLTINPENKKKIETFENDRGENIVRYLKERAWEEDLIGKTVYYLIKSEDGDVLLFFSLKCGALFNAQIDNKFLQELINLFKSLDDKNKSKYSKTKKLIQNIILDDKREVNKKIARVLETYPGIELMHFCINNNAKEIWKSYGINRPMGEVIFWYFIVPLIEKIQNQIGCEYIFLFAADHSEDATLINYYNISLNFKQTNEVATNKPSYDFCCSFMCQKIDEMKQKKNEYFDNFNLDENDIIA